MKVKVMIAALGMSVALGAGSALAWDLHDTLAPGPTPGNVRRPAHPTEDVPAGADLRPARRRHRRCQQVGGSSAVHDSRCADALATHGENSAEAWTQC